MPSIASKIRAIWCNIITCPNSDNSQFFAEKPELLHSRKACFRLFLSATVRELPLLKLHSRDLSDLSLILSFFPASLLEIRVIVVLFAKTVMGDEKDLEMGKNAVFGYTHADSQISHFDIQCTNGRNFLDPL